MKPVLSHLPALLPLAALALAGCVGHPTRGVAIVQPAPGPQAAPAARHTPAHSPARPSGGRTRPSRRPAADAPVEATSPAPAAVSAGAEPLPDATGVPSCDEYLSSYVACHRAAAIYRPEQIEAHFQAMRTSLVRDAQDPDIRPQLAGRCNALATQLRRALHGRSCNGGPASTGSTPSG